MTRNSITYITALLAVVTLSSSSIVNPVDKSGNFELLILHNNDMHARFEQTSQLSGACTVVDREAGKCYGGFPRVAHVVKEARKAAALGQGPPVLYLNAGDTYTGTAWFTIYKWKIAAEFINALEPDAVSLGNHEFDNGIGGLTPFIANLTCPVLAANLILTAVPELAREPNLKKSVIKEVEGVKIGIVGYLTPETKTMAISNDVEYIEEVVALQKEVKLLQEAGIKIIIAVGHSGFAKDIEIAQKVEGIDLVIGGHTNTFLWNGTQPDVEIPEGPYPKYIKQASGRMVPVVQAYAYTKYLGKLHMVFDANGEIKKVDGNPILLDKSVPQDPEILKIIKIYDEKVNALANEILGNTSLVFNRLTCRIKECTLGNLITDSMIHRYAATYTGTYWTDAPVAIIQRGGIRSSLTHRMITKGDLLTVLPFDGHLNVIKINGSVFLKALEHSVANYNLFDPPGAFLHFSGVKVVYDLKKPPGSRVVRAEVRCSECETPSYSKLQNGQTYSVILPDFVSNGGDGFAMFKNQPTYALNYNEMDATEYYVKHRSPIFAELEGRITILGDSSRSSVTKSLSLSLVITLAVSTSILL